MQAKFAPPDELLATLKSGASQRAQKSLDLIHSICKEQIHRGSYDFSVATIGRLSHGMGGPGTQPIRNKSGERYRALIEGWQKLAEGSARKSLVRPEAGVAEDLLNMIDDATVRAVVGIYIAENKKLKRENSVLKGNTQIVYDRREVADTAHAKGPVTEIVAPLNNLLPAEIEALQHAISPQLMSEMGWKAESNGRVNDKRTARAIYKPGYIVAINKVLSAVKEK